MSWHIYRNGKLAQEHDSRTNRYRDPHPLYGEKELTYTEKGHESI